MPSSRDLRRLPVIGLGLAIAGLCRITVPANAAAGGEYVALGDSYTSGPLISPAATAPALCLQSAANYPHLTAAALGLSLTAAWPEPDR
jgi:hypothetical protein